MYNELSAVAMIKAAENAGQGVMLFAGLHQTYIIVGLAIICFVLIGWLVHFIYELLLEKFGKEDDNDKYLRF